MKIITITYLDVRLLLPDLADIKQAAVIRSKGKEPPKPVIVDSTITVTNIGI